ncbi:MULTISPECIES: sensor histidine kinase [unclassified Streptomyces]|uniref:sensor histidine kinase n=1 Tax=unclassified Streptomyces TaxID=2593676 RepID=UPI00099CDB5B|nr:MULTISPECIES: histidine kinase [unclassified Streptomyces]
MSRLTGWWSRRSSAGKVELYTRWTFHLFVPIELFVLGGIPFNHDGRSQLPTEIAVGLLGWIGVHAVLCAFLASRALDHATGKRERPVRLAVTVAGTTLGADLVLNLLWAARTLPEPGVNVTVLAGTSVFTLCALVLCLGPVRHMVYAVLGTAFATGAPMAAAGNGLDVAAGSAVGVLIGGVFVSATSGFSSWLLRIVKELENSRDLKARLAVAEERLRFGRDLHDVMGRNLSVIALKSELAVQLSRRGRPEAVDQMVEVQRIAQESQREVREVVRGYREADLRVELEGARGVLGAAGIACAVDAPVLDLPPEVQSALGWVVRETTTNVLRHGDARRCAIVLRAEPGAVLLTVENDGAEEGNGTGGGSEGTGAADAPGRVGRGGRGAGSGLAGLRERLGAVDGTLDAGPSAPQSFRVTARVPLPRAGRGGAARKPAAPAHPVHEKPGKFGKPGGHGNSEGDEKHEIHETQEAHETHETHEKEETVA